MIYNDASHDILHFQIQNKTASLKANYFHLRICLRMVINGRGFTLGRGEPFYWVGLYVVGTVLGV